MCAWNFADSFDLYAAPADMANGYWDIVSGTLPTFVAGRFAGSQALQYPAAASYFHGKNSSANDAVHHIVVAFRQTSGLAGSTNYTYFQLSDGANIQCSIIFRSDGAVLLTSGGTAGSTIATYTSAVTAANTWYAFELEVFISSTAGYMNVRKNGNTVNDFTSATNLNTRAGSTNNYANRLYIGSLNVGASAHQLDDLFWRSDASSVAWLGDIRCYTRMPASDASVQFSRLGGATNTSQVSEAHQDGLTTYVFDSNPGDADFYNIGSIASTPVTTFAVVTRGYMQKSDAGTRTAAVQIKSGGTTVASPTLVLTTSGFLWAWRMDLTDPATSAAWTAAAVNNVTIGPTTVA
jgi:hypothetical protein